ncbi:CCA tRNA nucleotidyltransferase [Aliarcobacter lanthieri]|uniref:CCA tRNA nucleotidyltransferase n=1 Tax=Aliarcobacter lanthieri TaxID=1355374 RepID=UPI0009DDBEC1|nr:CCA tRNA nucleotidyltransferase [Aliarcobacter lanthieri]QKF58573.1 multifunctional tRNA nucleotidyl transferase / 2'3'-cyclic phosphodiesterase / 2'nucleotidase / phosphatase [Aliarcobacter lanthieri]
MFINITKIDIPKILVDILNDLKSLGAKPILVGGCVRDSFLGKQIKDYDIEIFDLNHIEIIQKCLEKYSSVKLVGKSFGVLTLKIDGYDFDFSLPRYEQKTGCFHQDFEVFTNANLSFKEASKRRDFTINAIGYDYFNNIFLDEFDGIEDLKNKKIKHINDTTFIEDSLRVYRAIQFASRFEFEIDKNTKKLCKKLVINNELKFLPKERVFEELKKLLLKSNRPSIGIKLLKEFNIMDFTTNAEIIDNLAEILKDKDFDEFRKLYLFYSCLTKNLEDKELIKFLNSLTNDKKLIKEILLLQKSILTKDEKDIKRLSLKLKVEDLIVLNKAFKNDIAKEAETIAKNINILNTPLKALVIGKDLVALGFKPSQIFGDILDFAINLQIDRNLTKEDILEEILMNFKII